MANTLETYASAKIVSVRYTRSTSENGMNKDLKEALEVVKNLRAALQLAQFELAELSDEEANALLAEAEALLRKHGQKDDMMDIEDEDGAL